MRLYKVAIGYGVAFWLLSLWAAVDGVAPAKWMFLGGCYFFCLVALYLRWRGM